jgi:hypothetical protein
MHTLNISNQKLIKSIDKILEKRVVIDDSDVQRKSLTFHSGNKITIFADIIVTCEVITAAGYIEDEGYQRPEPAEVTHHIDFDSFYFYETSLDNMRETEIKVSGPQITDIVIPRLEKLIELW